MLPSICVFFFDTYILKNAGKNVVGKTEKEQHIVKRKISSG